MQNDLQRATPCKEWYLARIPLSTRPRKEPKPPGTRCDSAGIWHLKPPLARMARAISLFTVTVIPKWDDRTANQTTLPLSGHAGICLEEALLRVKDNFLDLGWNWSFFHNSRFAILAFLLRHRLQPSSPFSPALCTGVCPIRGMIIFASSIVRRNQDGPGGKYEQKNAFHLSVFLWCRGEAFRNLIIQHERPRTSSVSFVAETGESWAAPPSSWSYE